jgi:lipoate synthase
MNIGPINITTDVSVFSLFLLIVLGVCLIVTLRVYKNFKKLTKSLCQLQNEFRAINSGQLGMGRVIRKVSEEIANVESLQQLSSHHGTSEKIYDQAGLLLARGATIEEVVESCDIAPAEAELIAIMTHSAPSHKRNRDNTLAA